MNPDVEELNHIIRDFCDLGDKDYSSVQKILQEISDKLDNYQILKSGLENKK